MPFICSASQGRANLLGIVGISSSISPNFTADISTAQEAGSLVFKNVKPCGLVLLSIPSESHPPNLTCVEFPYFILMQTEKTMCSMYPFYFSWFIKFLFFCLQFLKFLLFLTDYSFFLFTQIIKFLFFFFYLFKSFIKLQTFNW